MQSDLLSQINGFFGGRQRRKSEDALSHDHHENDVTENGGGNIFLDRFRRKSETVVANGKSGKPETVGGKSSGISLVRVAKLDFKFQSQFVFRPTCTVPLPEVFIGCKKTYPSRTPRKHAAPRPQAQPPPPPPPPDSPLSPTTPPAAFQLPGSGNLDLLTPEEELDLAEDCSATPLPAPPPVLLQPKPAYHTHQQQNVRQTDAVTSATEAAAPPPPPPPPPPPEEEETSAVAAPDVNGQSVREKMSNKDDLDSFWPPILPKPDSPPPPPTRPLPPPPMKNGKTKGGNLNKGQLSSFKAPIVSTTATCAEKLQKQVYNTEIIPTTEIAKVTPVTSTISPSGSSRRSHSRSLNPNKKRPLPSIPTEEGSKSGKDVPVEGDKDGWGGKEEFDPREEDGDLYDIMDSTNM
ncbi:pollen-specific leucine-rich repeat extensin-like protein 1 [Aplysia californica]|uniref:Pollen-specific leucine-rich repeat extensin-like protein 1 n=1 Tax=Aplysia californica TaxID=6500 RepID=A0ABM1ABJ9_APLCA|nr:pollen-specific leucine-rich repeat extensin-like protein 1 [Aplysia californica]